MKPQAVSEEITYRKLKSIDMDAMRDDLIASDLCCKQFTDLNELVQCYNNTLASALDRHAPLKSKTVARRKRVPWFSSEIKSAIQSRRKAERKWKTTRCECDLLVFKRARNYANFIMKAARREYYTSFIQNNSSDQRKLFQSVKTLLCEPSSVSFPADMDPTVLANDFGEFFAKKIENIYTTLDALQSESSLQAVDTLCDTPVAPPDGVAFPAFKSLTQKEVRDLNIRTAPKSCPLDPTPTSLVVELLDVLLPSITSMINLSFESATFAEQWKEALVFPSLKKPGLQTVFKNFRPVSNLPYISKLSEKASVVQLTSHSLENGLDCELQSAYNKYHNTESAL